MVPRIQISKLQADVCPTGTISVGGIVLDLAGTGERSCIAEISLSEPGGSYHIIYPSQPGSSKQLRHF